MTSLSILDNEPKAPLTEMDADSDDMADPRDWKQQLVEGWLPLVDPIGWLDPLVLALLFVPVLTYMQWVTFLDTVVT